MVQLDPRTSNYFSALGEEHTSPPQARNHQSPMTNNIQSSHSGEDGGIGIDVSCKAHGRQVQSLASHSSPGSHPKEGSSNIDPNEEALSVSSLASPGSLSLENLNITRNGPYRSKEPHKQAAPFQRVFRNSHDTSWTKNFPTSRESGLPHTTSSFGGRAGGRAQRNSHTWISADTQAQQEYMIIRNAMRRLFKHSEIAKWKLADYIAHREAMIASQANILAIKVKAREEAISLRIPPISLESQENLHSWGIFGNFDQRGNFGRVLGESTIWCHDWTNGKDEIAPWPSLAELKWEGDDRAKTGVGRFLPLPREEAPPGLTWNQLPIVEQYPMDQVARIPTMEDVYLPVDDQIEEEMQYLWSQELERAIDDFLDL